MNESQDNYGESKQPDRKNLENANESTVTESRSVVALGGGTGTLRRCGREGLKIDARNFLGVIGMFTL